MTNLQLQSVCCGYGTRRVLAELSLAARAGEMLVLLGPNGAGKTTLLRAMARLLRPTKGSIVLEERDIWDLPRAEYSRQVALMPQTERRDWPLTVEESVCLGRAPHRGWVLPFTGHDRRIVEQALQNTGLCKLRLRPITELSGGEWRRMILARALAQEATILLLDEPTSGLDLKYQVEVLRLVRQLASRSQLTVIITLHDLNHASMFGDRLAILANGALAALGPPREVLTPEVVSRAFGIPVAVTPHPVYRTPLVVPLLDGTTQWAS